MKTQVLILYTMFSCFFLGLSTCASADVDVPKNGNFKWEIKKNISIGFGFYGQFDASTTKRSDASFGTGAIKKHALDTEIRRADLVLYGSVYSWNYVFVYLYASNHDVKRGIDYFWASRKVGLGKLYLGQHWAWGSIDNAMSGKNVMFLERNQITNGLGDLRDRGQGAFYKISTPYGSGNNNIFGGIAAFGLNDTLSGRHNASGYGVNTMIAWAPIVNDKKWLQLGAAYLHEKSNESNVGATAVSWVNHNLPVQPVTTHSGANGDTRIDTFYASAVGSYNSLYLQGEYARSRFNQTNSENDSVQAFTLQAGFWLTGETTPYDPSTAAYDTPKPLHSYGAAQLVLGFQQIKNLNINSNHRGDGRCNPVNTTSSFNSNAITNCRINQYRLGVNYWATPRTRITGQVTKAYADLGRSSKTDNPLTFELRFQFGFY